MTFTTCGRCDLSHGDGDTHRCSPVFDRFALAAELGKTLEQLEAGDLAIGAAVVAALEDETKLRAAVEAAVAKLRATA